MSTTYPSIGKVYLLSLTRTMTHYFSLRIFLFLVLISPDLYFFKTLLSDVQQRLKVSSKSVIVKDTNSDNISFGFHIIRNVNKFYNHSIPSNEHRKNLYFILLRLLSLRRTKKKTLDQTRQTPTRSRTW